VAEAPERTVRIALVHDYLTQYGGAERVVEAMHCHFPEAPIFTGVLDLDGLPVNFREMRIHPSFLDRIPNAGKRHRLFTPLYPLAFRQMGPALADFDVVIADSSAWSHHVRLQPNQILICYCHSPARFLYGDDDYLTATRMPGLARFAIDAVAGGLRSVDRRAARRVDRYLANSGNVAARIKTAYGRDARVVYPPIDTERFSIDQSVTPEDWFVVVSRLVPHKWIRLAVEACTRAGIPLKIVGDGRGRAELEAIAGPTIGFAGQRGDEDVVAFLRRSRGLILPGAEDFGMTAVEAQAVGRPVIAYGKGGALESVIDGETGLFFHEQTADSLLDAIARFSMQSWEPNRARANAERFSTQRFLNQIDEEIAAAISDRKSAASRPSSSPR
jgi:glycosyltransferase involved in cell wall biosynthesis